MKSYIAIAHLVMIAFVAICFMCKLYKNRKEGITTIIALVGYALTEVLLIIFSFMN